MGRPERHDVDYFPFFSKEGRTLFILENKYQCKGTGFFTNCLRFLSRAPNHHFQLQTESDRLYFFASVKCDPESAMDMIEIMVETGKLDSDLWISKKVIASQDFLNSIQEAYRKRENNCITIDEIKAIYGITSGRNAIDEEKLPEEIRLSKQSDNISSANNPQTKVKETKVKETKVNIPEFLKEIWPSFVEMRKKIKKPLTDKAIELTIKELEKLYPNNPEMQIKSIEQSIQRSWQGVFEINHNYSGKQEKPVGTKFANLKETVIS